MPKIASGYYENTVSEVYTEFQKRLSKNQALDFDDLDYEDNSVIYPCSRSS